MDFFSITGYVFRHFLKMIFYFKNPVELLYVCTDFNSGFFKFLNDIIKRSLFYVISVRLFKLFRVLLSSSAFMFLLNFVIFSSCELILSSWLLSGFFKEILLFFPEYIDGTLTILDLRITFLSSGWRSSIGKYTLATLLQSDIFLSSLAIFSRTFLARLPEIRAWHLLKTRSSSLEIFKYAGSSLTSFHRQVLEKTAFHFSQSS